MVHHFGFKSKVIAVQLTGPLAINFVVVTIRQTNMNTHVFVFIRSFLRVVGPILLPLCRTAKRIRSIRRFLCPAPSRFDLGIFRIA